MGQFAKYAEKAFTDSIFFDRMDTFRGVVIFMGFYLSHKANGTFSLCF
jgi:hypothetical protein